jgi:hypothetical protein
MPNPFPLTSLADLADGVTVVPFHTKHAQWVKNALFDNILYTINRRTDNTMAKRKSKKGQTTIFKTCI